MSLRGDAIRQPSWGKESRPAPHRIRNAKAFRRRKETRERKSYAIDRPFLSLSLRVPIYTTSGRYKVNLCSRGRQVVS